MAIALSQETEIRLRKRAEREGQDADVLADALLSNALDDDPDDLTSEQIAAVRSGIARGLEASATGKVMSIGGAIKDVRKRHGFPDTWGKSVDAAIE